MSSPSSLLPDEQFHCSICQDVFTDPVSIPCGHSFCQACIGRHWARRDPCQCPKCKATFPGRPEPLENSFAKEVAERIRARRRRGGRSSALRPAEVACDVCSGGMRPPARKSCQACLTSYRQTHLEPHQRAAALKVHEPVDPVEDLEDRMCEKHQRLLELFCRSDQMSVCALCMETDHRRHDTVPAERESTERKKQMQRTAVEVQQMIQTRLRKVEEIKRSVTISRTTSEKELDEGVRLFAGLIKSIQRRQAELVQEVEGKQRAAERRAEGLVEDLEREIAELQRRSAELERLSRTDDHLYLLQKCPLLSAPPPIKDWSEISVQSDPCVGTVRRAVSRAEETLRTAVSELSVEEHGKVQQYAVDVLLDPGTANPWLVLSEDRKRVWDGETQQNLPEGPERFDMAPCVLGVHGFLSGRRYWEVEVGDKTAWDLGVARESIDRKGVVTLSPEDGYWTICLRRRGEYRACAGQSVLLPIREKPWKVGVFLDYEEGVVSFYDAGLGSHIYSFIGCSFAERVFPLFNPDMSDSGDNKSPLVIICPVAVANGGGTDDVII